MRKRLNKKVSRIVLVSLGLIVALLAIPALTGWPGVEGLAEKKAADHVEDNFGGSAKVELEAKFPAAGLLAGKGREIRLLGRGQSIDEEGSDLLGRVDGFTDVLARLRALQTTKLAGATLELRGGRFAPSTIAQRNGEGRRYVVDVTGELRDPAAEELIEGLQLAAGFPVDEHIADERRALPALEDAVARGHVRLVLSATIQTGAPTEVVGEPAVQVVGIDTVPNGIRLPDAVAQVVVDETVDLLE